MDAVPDARVVLAYRMPTFVVGIRRLHVGVRKHGLPFYGWEAGRDGGFVARHPHLDDGRGTVKPPVGEAPRIDDAELRAFLAAPLAQ